MMKITLSSLTPADRRERLYSSSATSLDNFAPPWQGKSCDVRYAFCHFWYAAFSRFIASTSTGRGQPTLSLMCPSPPGPYCAPGDRPSLASCTKKALSCSSLRSIFPAFRNRRYDAPPYTMEIKGQYFSISLLVMTPTY